MYSTFVSTFPKIEPRLKLCDFEKEESRNYTTWGSILSIVVMLLSASLSKPERNLRAGKFYRRDEIERR